MSFSDRVVSETTLPGQEPRVLQDHAPDCPVRRGPVGECLCPALAALSLTVRVGSPVSRRPPEVELP